ncbi:TetR/AcrR family transcriptional regulator [Adlercreutzia sp. ZJ242]|uniref:TetR/AcrR family transcriptional regulator n=1 Tax=Adlercreutzia sp. ZJ242 TaxID=2709409 RepID=UPI0013EC46D0|nr:TetR/AcrR family transcriptional regulator [Adlercreutzia sp. ZJ242]
MTSDGCTDRRIARSRRALRAALIALTEERGLDGFTVNDLCARADLNRGTFYNHFRDKDDLLAQLEDEVMGDLRQFRGEMSKLTLLDLAKLKVAREPLPLLVELFDHLREQGDFLCAMLGPRGDARFGQRLRDTLCTDIILGLLHERYRSDPEPFVGYYVAFYASAYLGVITRWLERGMQESSEDMARIVMRLLFIKPGESIKL